MAPGAGFQRLGASPRVLYYKAVEYLFYKIRLAGSCGLTTYRVPVPAPVGVIKPDPLGFLPMLVRMEAPTKE